VALAFDGLVAPVAGGRPVPALSGALLGDLHARVTGDGGGYRTGNVRVGGFRARTPAGDVPHLVDVALGRATDGIEAPLLAASRLHLELLLIHPFRDGNGRTARLASSLILLNAGFRSTLFTSVEQHSYLEPGRYVDAFRALRATQPTDHDAWLMTALGMMAANARWAAWLRLREARLRRLVREAGVPGKAHNRALLDFDLGRPNPHPAASLLARTEKPWVGVARSMTVEELKALRHQTDRLRVEESDRGG
jgi:Fic family protein